MIENLPATGTIAAVFMIVVYLVKVLVDRRGVLDAASERRFTAAEKSWKDELARSLAEADARCQVKLDAMAQRIHANEAVTRALAAQYPENAPLQFLVSMLPHDQG